MRLAAPPSLIYWMLPLGVRSLDSSRASERLEPDPEGAAQAAELAEVADMDAPRSGALALGTRPLAPEGQGWRCVHACWHPASLEVLEERDGAWFLAEGRWTDSARWGNAEHAVVETLLKGPECTLPNGASFSDKEGNERTEARLAWWKSAPATLGDAMLFQGPPEGLDVDAPYENPEHTGYPETAPPVFFGHYWRSGPVQPVRPNAVCLDYSIGKGDRLVAYRLGGESRIQAERFHVNPLVAG